MEFSMIKTKDLQEIKDNLKSLKENADEWLTSEEAAAFLKISKKTLYRKRIAGDIPFAKINKLVYYKKADLQTHFQKYYNLSLKLEEFKKQRQLSKLYKNNINI